MRLVHRRSARLLCQALEAGRFAAIEVMAAVGCSVQLACRVLAVSESGYYARRQRPPSARSIRHVALTDLIGRVHLDSRGTYGARRIHAELTLGHGLVVGHGTVALLMQRAGIAGVTGRPRFRRIANMATATDLVERRFGREIPTGCG